MLIVPQAQYHLGGTATDQDQGCAYRADPPLTTGPPQPTHDIPAATAANGSSLTYFSDHVSRFPSSTSQTVVTNRGFQLWPCRAEPRAYQTPTTLPDIQIPICRPRRIPRGTLGTPRPSIATRAHLGTDAYPSPQCKIRRRRTETASTKPMSWI